VRVVDTSRESDGLAMSSRNVFLSTEQRMAAPTLYRALMAIKSTFDNGERTYNNLVDVGKRILNTEPLFTVEYISICGFLDGIELSNEQKLLPDGNIMVSAAVNFGSCRILDNLLLGKQC
jgi:pantoate--beta-alanine ligase